ncbi:MAG: hypothetical protein M1828_000294 [Chrysothrix sp. TS-e1954]|nr:MAG: hypothetical protein M1828_000294 [Chrysothrix sp. TS-e1954]
MDAQARGYGIPPSSTPAPTQILPGDRAYRPSGRRNQYFVPGEGIRREVMSADICKYLDNDATVKPGTYQGREGYMLYAYRNLTSAMLEDIRRDSAGWHHEQQQSSSRRTTTRRDLNPVQEYEKSKTYHHRHNEAGTPSPVTDYPSRPAPAPDYHRQGYYQEPQYAAPQAPRDGFAPTTGQPGYPGGYAPAQSLQDPRSPPQHEYPGYQAEVQAPYGYPQSGQPPHLGRPGYPPQPQLGPREPQYGYPDPRIEPRHDYRHDPRVNPALDPRQYGDPRADPRQPQERGYRR